MSSAARRRAAIFVGSSALTMIAGSVITALLARTLTVDAYGSYAFANSFLLFAATFFEFGLFLPASRLAAKAEPKTRRNIVGASLIVYAPVGILFSIFVLVASYFVHPIFHVSAGGALLLIAPIAFVYPFDLVALQLAQGLDKLHAYSLTTVVTRLSLAALVALVVVRGWSLSLETVLLLQSVLMLAGWSVLIARLRPVLRGSSVHIRRLVREAREYGAAVYMGRILGIGSYNMDVLLVASLTNPASVGYYSLAGAIAAVVSLPAIGMAAVLFPRMTMESRLDPRWLKAAATIGFATAVLVSLGGGTVIRLAFGGRYGPALHLLYPLAAAAAIRGITAIYNQFLSAHARGSDLRNAAMVLTVSNLVFDLLLIPRYGASGAAWASLFALIVNQIAHALLYRRYVSALSSTACAAVEPRE